MIYDYKIIGATREAGMTVADVRVYSGDVTTENEMNWDTRKMESVTRYRRTGVIRVFSVCFKGDLTVDALAKNLNVQLKDIATVAKVQTIEKQSSYPTKNAEIVQ